MLEDLSRSFCSAEEVNRLGLRLDLQPRRITTIINDTPNSTNYAALKVLQEWSARVPDKVQAYAILEGVLRVMGKNEDVAFILEGRGEGY